MHPTQNPPADIDPSPADVLRRAALYLQRHGWCQGEFFDRESTDPFPPACAAGAVRAVVCGDTTDCLYDDGADEEIYLVDRAQLVLAMHVYSEFDLFEHSSLQTISDWNDSESRNADNVVAELNAAADRWEQEQTNAVSGQRLGGLR